MPGLFERVRAWRLARRRRTAAIRRALLEFRASRGINPLGGHVLRLGPPETIVRVTYFTNHIPPDRAWYGVSEVDGTVRELSSGEVACLESPWR
jgi:hypothetical protein